MDGEPSGIRIPYVIKSADFGGNGIFTPNRVPAGTLIWKFTEGVNVVAYDAVSAADHLKSLTPAEAKWFLDTTYGIGGEWVQATKMYHKIRSQVFNKAVIIKGNFVKCSVLQPFSYLWILLFGYCNR